MNSGYDWSTSAQTPIIEGETWYYREVLNNMNINVSQQDIVLIYINGHIHNHI